MSKEAMNLAFEVMQAAIKSGDWKVDGACDPDMALRALEEALANHSEDNLDMVKQEHPIERNFCERCGKRAFDGIHTCTPPAKQEQGEQDEFLLRGVLASELKCWHRLTADESQNLIDFVKNMGAKQEQGEPVAEVTSETGAEVTMSWWHEPALPIGTKLYTTPQQRKPLTDEQIDEIYFKSDLDIERQYNQLYAFARAIEATHGIKD